MTGERLTAADALYCGLATGCVPVERWPELMSVVPDCAPGDLAEAIARFSIEPPAGPIERNRAVIDRCFDADNLDEIAARLTEDGGAFARAALEAMRAAAPASLQITLDLLRSARGRSLADCLRMELDLAKSVTRGPDFAEGVRAMVVDKDRRPRWTGTGAGPL